MVSKIPTTYNLTQEDTNNLYKLWKTWNENYLENLKIQKKQKRIKFLKEYFGWIVAVLAMIKPIIDAILSIRSLMFP